MPTATAVALGCATLVPAWQSTCGCGWEADQADTEDQHQESTRGSALTCAACDTSRRPAQAGFACPYLERGLQQEALLCIHELCLDATQPKQGDVKQVGGTQEAAKAGGQAARLQGGRGNTGQKQCVIVVGGFTSTLRCLCRLPSTRVGGKGTCMCPISTWVSSSTSQCSRGTGVMMSAGASARMASCKAAQQTRHSGQLKEPNRLAHSNDARPGRPATQARTHLS